MTVTVTCPRCHGECHAERMVNSRTVLKPDPKIIRCAQHRVVNCSRCQIAWADEATP